MPSYQYGMADVRVVKCINCGWTNKDPHISKTGDISCDGFGRLITVKWLPWIKSILPGFLFELPMLATALFLVVLIPALIALFGTAIRNYIKYNW